MKACKEFETRISALIDDELPAAERPEVMAHLAECPACKAYWEELLAVGEILREETTPAPAGFSEAVMVRVRETRQERKLVAFPVWKSVAAIAACCTIAVLGVWMMDGTGGNSMMDSAVSNSGAPESYMRMDGDQLLPEEPMGLGTGDTAVCESEPDSSADDRSAAYGALITYAAAIYTASDVAEEWVEENLGREWTAGSVYTLSEVQYDALRRALQEAGESFNEIMGDESGDSYLLIAE